MDITKELSQYNVSRETVQKLHEFVELLTSWNQKMNLVSRNSLDCVWERHVLDSVQLIKYIPTSITHLLDIGSGSGFPAVVLAILMQEKIPEAKVTMVESIAKKTMYLKDVCGKLNLDNANIINSRVESISMPAADIITARAVASLDILCGYTAKIGSNKTESLFLKGRSYETELAEAQKNWKFDLQVCPNKYCDDGVILKLSKLGKCR